jgi:Methylase involved in ubiquinone/menaquinone biosynthesis
MSQTQRDAYANSERIESDPWGILSRDNRNHHKKQRLILDATAAAPGDRVLEVGCGHGLHARQYAERFDYTGIDISESLLAVAREQAPGGRFELADAMTLPYQRNAFDAVVGTAILHHLPDAAAALREWVRVATGSVTLVEPNYLFPKECISTHTQPEEQHKSQMAPWRVRRVLAGLDASAATVEPVIYTPPWPDLGD